MSAIYTLNLLLWLVVFGAFVAVGIKIDKKIAAGPPRRTKTAIAVTWGIISIVVGAFHPMVLTYPTMPMFGMEKHVAAEVLPDGSLRRLPYGAIDPLLDGPVVRLGEKMQCHWTIGFEFKGTNIGARVVPGMIWIKAEVEDDIFYRAYGLGSRGYRPFGSPASERFCGEVRAIVNEEFRRRIEGKPLDFNPEIAPETTNSTEWLASSIGGTLADKLAGNGASHFEVRLGG